MNRFLTLTAFLGAVGCGQANDDKAAAPDNTEKNERDRDAASKTPMDQAENEADIAITATIRKAVVAHDELSMTAKNVKIITADGVVTLRGPVRSDAEKEAIASVAKGTDGVKSVENQIEVAAE